MLSTAPSLRALQGAPERGIDRAATAAPGVPTHATSAMMITEDAADNVPVEDAGRFDNAERL